MKCGCESLPKIFHCIKTEPMDKTINRFIVTKTIYASKVTKTQQEVLSILNLEIESHISINPDLKYCGKQDLEPVKTKFGEHIYTLKFTVK